jgi:mannose/fructose/N-acetylgalactosamine-specific phosphotransferase system component IIC
VRCMALSKEVHDKMKAGGALLVAIGFAVIIFGTFNEQIRVVRWLPHNYGAYIGFGLAVIGGITIGCSKDWHHHETVEHIYVSSPDEELG